MIEALFSLHRCPALEEVQTGLIRKYRQTVICIDLHEYTSINRENIAFNDVAGNFSVTLLDVLDTLVVLDDRQGFERAVRNVIDWVSFDVNTKPQVFETTIRALGGLLSGHIFANQTGQPFYLPWYRGELLNLAHDLGERLLPAFSTPTGIPYARVFNFKLLSVG